MRNWYKRHKISSRLGVLAACIGFVASISDLQQRFFPRGITVHLPSINPSWIFWAFAALLFGVVYLQENRENSLAKLKEKISVRIESAGELFGIKRIKVVLKSGTTTRNVTVKIISITPQPNGMDATAFPLFLPCESPNQILNPDSESKFDFCTIESVRDGIYGSRKITLADEKKRNVFFEIKLNEMLKDAFRLAYDKEHPEMKTSDCEYGHVFEIEISGLDFPAMVRKIRLRAYPSEGDIGYLSICEGYFISVI
jgi:hypothetical protein